MTDDELKQARLVKGREIASKLWKEVMRPEVLGGRFDYSDRVFCAVAALVEANWHPPVDPDLLIAREAVAQIWDNLAHHKAAEIVLAGGHDDNGQMVSALAAIKLYKSRMGA